MENKKQTQLINGTKKRKEEARETVLFVCKKRKEMTEMKKLWPIEVDKRTMPDLENKHLEGLVKDMNDYVYDELLEKAAKIKVPHDIAVYSMSSSKVEDFKILPIEAKDMLQIPVWKEIGAFFLDGADLVARSSDGIGDKEIVFRGVKKEKIGNLREIFTLGNLLRGDI